MSSFDPGPKLRAGQKEFVHEPISDPNLREHDFVATGIVGEAEADPEASPPTPEAIREKAYAEGVEAGHAELPWQEAEELRGLIETLEQALSGVAELRRSSLREQRVIVVELAIAIAEKLLRQSIETDPDMLAAIVERAVATLPEEEKLRVVISNEDYQTLQAGMAATLASFCDDSGAEIEASAELAPGDVRIFGAVGDVDARITSLLARVREGLVDLYDIPEVSP